MKPWAGLLLLWLGSLQAAVVHHNVDLSDGDHQQIRIETRVQLPAGYHEWTMAVWTPGSYLLREFSRQIESLEAVDDAGQPLRLEKLGKNRWRVQAPQRGAVHLRYRIHAAELSVRTSWLDPEFALLNPASLFLYPAAHPQWPHEVELLLPPDWAGSHADLERLGEDRYRAANYDQLVDNPLVAGRQLAVTDFAVAGVPLKLVSTGDLRYWDNEQAAMALQQLVREQAEFWGGQPYPRYSFINLLVESGGGLEHDNNTVIMGSRFAQRTRKGWTRWLELASHELFHAWNVRRLRPASLKTYDYQQENYTRELWFAEGFTSYYQSLLAHRAGLTTEKELLARLAARIRSLENTPGQRVQSLAEASFDAWIKYYRPDAHSQNSRVSYYTRGAVIALLLDARLRRQGKITLDDFMRAAWQRFHASGYRNEDLYALLAELAGESQANWLRQQVEQPTQLDYSRLQTDLGLELVRSKKPVEEPELPPAWLDLQLEKDSLVLKKVRKGSSLWRAGLLPGDELIALDGYRLYPDRWKKSLQAYRPEETLTLTFARRDRLYTRAVELEAPPLEKWKLVPVEKPNRATRKRFQGWLAGR